MLNRRSLLTTTFAAAGLAATGFAGRVEAHHGWGSYDSTKTLTLNGVVDRVVPDNPHGELILKADGKSWQVILSPPSRMAARGKPIGEIKAGDALVAVGYASKSVAGEMRAERITHNGVTVELR